MVSSRWKSSRGSLVILIEREDTRRRLPSDGEESSITTSLKHVWHGCPRNLTPSIAELVPDTEVAESGESHSAKGKDSPFFHLKRFFWGREHLEGFTPPVLHLKPYNMFLQGLVRAGSRKASFCEELTEFSDLLEDAKSLISV